MNQLLTKLLEQSAIIIVMGVMGYIMWKYIKEKNTDIKEKDVVYQAIIEKKDKQLAEQTKELMTLYGKAVESQNKLATTIDELRRDLRDKKLV